MADFAQFNGIDYYRRYRYLFPLRRDVHCTPCIPGRASMPPFGNGNRNVHTYWYLDRSRRGRGVGMLAALPMSTCGFLAFGWVWK